MFKNVDQELQNQNSKSESLYSYYNFVIITFVTVSKTSPQQLVLLPLLGQTDPGMEDREDDGLTKPIFVHLSTVFVYRGVGQSS